MLLFRKPSSEFVEAFLARQRREPFSYREVGASRHQPPVGFVVDHHRIRLSHSHLAFEAGCAALRRWDMFSPGWAQICGPDHAIAPATTVGILAHWGPLWWLSACRIVYVIDEIAPARRFGFAYGTLPDHAERGEERFLVEQLEDGTVWYDLLAFSRPRHWLVKSAIPSRGTYRSVSRSIRWRRWRAR